MQILIEIPDSDIPKKQDIIEVPIHFIDGIVCEAGGFGFCELPKEHGDLIDRNELLEWSYEINSMYCEYDKVVNVTDIKDVPAIIEADEGTELVELQSES